ncbi:MAG: DUF4255 domain-containing protein [Gemmatimonadetes bacterium]|nr:DUF4255 domain-containing protein [Gemmatimonadota bacterium]
MRQRGRGPWQHSDRGCRTRPPSHHRGRTHDLPSPELHLRRTPPPPRPRIARRPTLQSPRRGHRPPTRDRNPHRRPRITLAPPNTAAPPTRSEPAPATIPLLELDLLLSFGGSDYGESLDLLAKTIDFLHAHPIWSADTQLGTGAAPLPTSLDRITLHPVALSHEDQHHVWSALGAPYVASVVYHVALVPAGER